MCPKTIPSPSGWDINSIQNEMPLEKSDSTSNPHCFTPLQNLGTFQKKLFGVLLSIISGICYGVNYDPVQYIIDNFPNASTNSLDYAFSHFTGIILMSTLLFVCYLIIRRNNPWVNHRSILPSFISGTLWAIAQTSFFIANSKLSITVSFPLSSIGPGIVAALWGIFVFAEIRGARNYLFLFLAFLLSAISITLITLSKVLDPGIF